MVIGLTHTYARTPHTRAYTHAPHVHTYTTCANAHVRVTLLYARPNTQEAHAYVRIRRRDGAEVVHTRKKERKRERERKEVYDAAVYAHAHECIAARNMAGYFSNSPFSAAPRCVVSCFATADRERVRMYVRAR